MKAPINQMGLIKPFNLDRVENEQMFAELPPRQVIMTVTLAAVPELCEDHARAGFEAVAVQLHDMLGGKAIEPLPLPVRGLLPLLQLSDLSPLLMETMTDEQKAWIHNGYYVQTGFQEGLETQEVSFAEGIFWGMTVLDSIVSASGSTDPIMHASLSVAEFTERIFRYRVNELFKDRVGVWNSSLLDYRNLVQVKCHAILQGRDPDVEWGCFVKAGGKYFLEYPTICP